MNKEISDESQKYLFLLSQLGIDIKIEQDPKFRDKWKIGRRHIYKDQLEQKLKELYESSMQCRTWIQKISNEAHKLQFDIDFKSWENLNSAID